MREVIKTKIDKREYDTISSLLSAMAEDICDNYCRYPRDPQYDNGDGTCTMCDNCPLNVLGSI